MGKATRAAVDRRIAESPDGGKRSPFGLPS